MNTDARFGGALDKEVSHVTKLISLIIATLLALSGFSAIPAYADEELPSEPGLSETPTLQAPHPGIQTSAQVGDVLTVSHARASSFVPVADGVDYQWFRGDIPIAGTNSTTYTVVSEDLDSVISVVATGYKDGYQDTSVSSNATSPVTAGTLVAATPTISGTLKVGNNLTAKIGTWTEGVTPTYQWFADGKTISGATNATYTLTTADAGKKISVQVTGAKTGYTTTSKTSASTKAVPKLALTKATPKISGTAKVGKTLTAKPGIWTKGTSLKYQWYRNGKAISKATKPTYKLQPADGGKKLSVKVTGSKASYTTASATSAKTKAVAKLALKKGTPKISGTAKVGKTLTVKKGTWTKGTSFKYQWYRNGKAISKATKPTYKLKAADANKRISVKVTGSKAGYKTASKTSASKTAKRATLSMGQKNAIGSARDYLDFMAFSRSGLIDQLKFEGYSTANATFAVDYISPNWNKQAAKCAREYLDYMSFSRKGLIDQLIYEGFTKKQAEYGVKAVGY